MLLRHLGKYNTCHSIHNLSNVRLKSSKSRNQYGTTSHSIQRLPLALTRELFTVFPPISRLINDAPLVSWQCFNQTLLQLTRPCPSLASDKQFLPWRPVSCNPQNWGQVYWEGTWCCCDEVSCRSSSTGLTHTVRRSAVLLDSIKVAGNVTDGWQQANRMWFDKVIEKITGRNLFCLTVYAGWRVCLARHKYPRPVALTSIRDDCELSII